MSLFTPIQRPHYGPTVCHGAARPDLDRPRWDTARWQQRHSYHQPAGSFPRPQSCGIGRRSQALSPLSLAQSAEESGGLGAPRSVATIFSPHSVALAGPGHPPWILRATEHPQGWVGQASHGDSTRWGRSRWLGWGLDTHTRGTRMSRGSLISYHHSVNTTAANSARPGCWQYILSHHSEGSGGHREHTASRPCHTFQALASLEE